MKGSRSYSGEQCKQKNDTKWAANVVTLGEVVASDWREFRILFLINLLLPMTRASNHIRA